MNTLGLLVGPIVGVDVGPGLGTELGPSVATVDGTDGTLVGFILGNADCQSINMF